MEDEQRAIEMDRLEREVIIQIRILRKTLNKLDVLENEEAESEEEAKEPEKKKSFFGRRI